MTATLISIIGPPAAGKTTLAEWLAEALPAKLIREDYAGNPFLADSYAGQEQAQLPGQLYFLMSRVEQLAISSWPESGVFVSDYGFCQDRIYARARLSEDDFRLYSRVAKRLEGLVHPPDIVIHLDASEDALLERIARRGRDFEKAMTREFLAAMRDEYNKFEAQAGCPIIAIDTEQTNMMDDPKRRAVLAELVQKIEKETA